MCVSNDYYIVHEDFFFTDFDIRFVCMIGDGIKGNVPTQILGI